MSETKLVQYRQETSTPFAPRTIDEGLALAKTLAGSGLLPQPLHNKPTDVFVVLMTGHELGLSPMQAVRGLLVINGKAIMSSDLMVALVLKHRDVCEYFRLVKSTDTEATYETKRAGSEPVSLSWTMDQAKKAGLAGKGTWTAHPAAMLRARCASSLARAVYPDLVLGVYDTDEGAEIGVTVGPAARLVERIVESDVVQAPAPDDVPEVQVSGEAVDGEAIPLTPREPPPSLEARRHALWERMRSMGWAPTKAKAWVRDIVPEATAAGWTLDHLARLEAALDAFEDEARGARE